MTQFALTVWAYQQTGQATALALVGFFSFAPGVIFMPLAGAVVDRSNRKAAMMLSDITALISATVIFLLYRGEGLQIWHLCAAGWFTGTFQAFQWPAYSAAISLMIPKQQYARASSLMAVAEYGSNIFAPIFASALLALIGIGGILILDVFSYAIAIVSLLLVTIPPPATLTERRPILREMAFGFRYIIARKGLLGLQTVYFIGNFASQFFATLLPAMVLARTSNDQNVLATVQTGLGVGGVLGAVIITWTGGPKRKPYGVLVGWIMYLFFSGWVAIGQTPLWWIVMGFLAFSFVALLDSSNQAIWQSKIPPNMQGRVFSARAVIARCATPLAALMAGPLADYFFEPAFFDGTLLGGLFGVGKGAGTSALMTISCFAGIVAAVIGISLPFIRNVDRMIPDHDQVTTPTTA
jgi:MFS family permease